MTSKVQGQVRGTHRFSWNFVHWLCLFSWYWKINVIICDTMYNRSYRRIKFEKSPLKKDALGAPYPSLSCHLPPGWVNLSLNLTWQMLHINSSLGLNGLVGCVEKSIQASTYCLPSFALVTLPILPLGLPKKSQRKKSWSLLWQLIFLRLSLVHLFGEFHSPALTLRSTQDFKAKHVLDQTFTRFTKLVAVFPYWLKCNRTGCGSRKSQTGTRFPMQGLLPPVCKNVSMGLSRYLR